MTRVRLWFSRAAVYREFLNVRLASFAASHQTNRESLYLCHPEVSAPRSAQSKDPGTVYATMASPGTFSQRMLAHSPSRQGNRMEITPPVRTPVNSLPGTNILGILRLDSFSRNAASLAFAQDNHQTKALPPLSHRNRASPGVILNSIPFAHSRGGVFAIQAF